MVFVSANDSSPMSMFGHTFLVFHYEELPEPESAVIEYLGTPTASKGIITHGLFLGIDGSYRSNKFLNKLNEYDWEDRDTYIFRLKLTNQELGKIRNNVVNELKVINKTDYTFFRKNCSFYIFKLISDDKNFDNSLYTSPVDTINFLFRKGALGNPIFIESKKNILKAKFEILGETDRAQVRNLKYDQTIQQENLSAEGADFIRNYISYIIRREPDSFKRAYFFDSKKKLISSKNFEKPKTIFVKNYEAKGSKSLSMGKFRNDDAFELAFNPVQKNFFSSESHEGGFELEILSSKVLIADAEFFLKELKLMTIENFKASELFGFKYAHALELLYRNDFNYTGIDSREYLLRMGLGLGLAAKKVRMGCLLNLVGKNVTWRGGNYSEIVVEPKATINYWLTDKVAVNLKYGRTLNTRSEVKDSLELDGVFLLTNFFSIGASFRKSYAIAKEELQLKLIHNW